MKKKLRISKNAIILISISLILIMTGYVLTVFDYKFGIVLYVLSIFAFMGFIGRSILDNIGDFK